jgi:predicted RND superfamily exporter protein
VSAIDRVAGVITGHSKLVILVVLLATAAVGWGIQDVERSSNLAQFESETEATETAEYIADHFVAGDAETTTVQLVVRARDDGNVLSKESLIASLELQRELRSRPAINRTLVDENPTVGVANVVARTAAVREATAVLERRATELRRRNRTLQADAAELQQQRAQLQQRADDLQARREAFQEEYETIQSNRSRLEAAFADLQANRSTLQNRTDRLNATARSLATELETVRELQKESDALDVEMAETDLSKVEYDRRAAAIERRIARAKANASALPEINASEAATFNATAAEVRSLQHRLFELNRSLENDTISEYEYERETEDAESQLAAAMAAGTEGLLADEYAAAEARASELRERAEELQERRAALEEKAPEFQQRKERLEAEAAEIEQRKEQLQQRADELAEREATLEEDFAALQSDFEALRKSPPSPTVSEQIEQLRSMNESEFETHVSTLLGPNSTFSGGDRALDLLSTNYQPGSTSANARVVVVTQDVGETSAVAAPGAYGEEITDAQLAVDRLADRRSGEHGQEYLSFGMGIVTDEIDRSMVDSLTIVAPLALLFVLVTLLVAYRDVLDVLLGLLGIGLVLVWTFGFMGWFDVVFNQIMIAVPVLLIGLSIDYAIHIFMRHREERMADVNGTDSPRGSMKIALAGVGVALVYVTATTVIGFLSNLTSPVPPIQDFGVVSAVGITAALLVFGLLIPALKVELDSLLERFGLDRRKRAFGTGGGWFSRGVSLGSAAARRLPIVVILLALVLSAGAGYYGSQVDTTFEEEDFIADEPREWMDELPEPFAPGEYSIKENMEYVYGNFQTPDQQGEILIEAGGNGDVTSPAVLQRIDRAATAAEDKRAVYIGPGGDPDVRSPVTVMRDVAATNATFSETFQRADTDDDGVPDENVTAVYEALYEVAPERARTVIQRTGDGEYVALRMQIAVSGSFSPGAITSQMESLAAVIDGTENVEATATGDPIVTNAIQDQLFETVVQSLAVTLAAVFVFLMLAYRIRTGSATLAFVTLLPVVLAVGWILGTMYVLEIPFNAITGTITSLTIGLGVAYAIHLSERYAFELDRHDSIAAAMDTSTVGTGGALLGSAATTAGGFGVLAFSILPALQQFGIITAITIVYACFGAVFVLPSLLVVWTRYLGPEVPLEAPEAEDEPEAEAQPELEPPDATGDVEPEQTAEADAASTVDSSMEPERETDDDAEPEPERTDEPEPADEPEPEPEPAEVSEPGSEPADEPEPGPEPAEATDEPEPADEREPGPEPAEATDEPEPADEREPEPEPTAVSEPGPEPAEPTDEPEPADEPEPEPAIGAAEDAQTGAREVKAESKAKAEVEPTDGPPEGASSVSTADDATTAVPMVEFDGRTVETETDASVPPGPSVAAREPAASTPSVERSIAPVDAEPGDTVTVSILARDRTGRVLLKESVPGVGGGVESFDPEPKIRTKDGRTIYVVWELEDRTSVGMTYTTTVPSDATPGETFAFEGHLSEDGETTAVGGDEAVTVADDRLAEFLEDDAVTDQDLNAAGMAVARNELSGEAFEKLYRRWLERPGEPSADDPDREGSNRNGGDRGDADRSDGTDRGDADRSDGTDRGDADRSDGTDRGDADRDAAERE